MDTAELPDLDFAGWLRRWDAQQQGYVPDREARFEAMFDALARLLPSSFVAVDLGCGPGSLSQRLLRRFPAARVVAVDIDPVMLAVGRGALGSIGGCLRWVEADLGLPGWTRELAETQVDAVLSSTALHWLEPQQLTRLYGDAAGLLRPGGLMLNADHLSFGEQCPAAARLSQQVLDEQWSEAAFAGRGIETAEQWWQAIRSEPGMQPLLAEQQRRFAGKQRPERAVDVDGHVAALRQAGFGEVTTIWQVLSDRVLLAVR